MNANSANGDAHSGLRTRGVLMERVRPIRWLWHRRIPLGLPSLVVGEEGVGKGTVMAWLIARATRGELDGDQKGEPINVLVVGDEDGFESVWVPRIHTAGGDLQRLRTLDDGEYLDDLSAHAEDLAATVERDAIGAIVLDQVLDHVNGGGDGSAVYNPKNVRQAMMPLRRVAGTYGIAAVGLLHPIKGRAGSFRELVAGSHQFNAVSRSSLLLGIDPDEPKRRILVRGKGNHSAAPRSFGFRIGASKFRLNEHDFEMPLVEDAVEGDRTVDDLMKARHEAPVRDAVAEQLEAVLTDEPQKLARLAEAVGRKPKDQSVRRALKALAEDGWARQTDEGWMRVRVPGRVSVSPLSGVTPDTAKAWRVLPRWLARRVERRSTSAKPMSGPCTTGRHGGSASISTATTNPSKPPGCGSRPRKTFWPVGWTSAACSRQSGILRGRCRRRTRPTAYDPLSDEDDE